MAREESLPIAPHPLSSSAQGSAPPFQVTLRTLVGSEKKSLSPLESGSPAQGLETVCVICGLDGEVSDQGGERQCWE